MRLVSDNSERDLARNRAADQVSWALRELAANLMRVTRGAGKPGEVARQCSAVVSAYQAHWDAVSHYPEPADVSNALEIWQERRAFQHDLIASGEDIAVKGALQTAASRLLGQRTQEAAGSSELFDGINNIEKGREAARRKWAKPQSTVVRQTAPKRTSAKTGRAIRQPIAPILSAKPSQASKAKSKPKPPPISRP